MRLLDVLLELLFSLVVTGIPVVDASKDSISPGESLTGNDRLVSSNGNYALGFFVQTGGSNSSRHGAPAWYLGTWLNRVPRVTPVWVANGDIPIADPATAELAISPDDGNLVIIVSNQVTKSIAWSSAVANATATTNTTTIATLSDGGNLILRSSSSNTSEILWQSFDHPTNSLLPGAKIGRDKITGLNRRLVSRKNTADQAPGMYSLELDPTGATQFVLVELSSGVTYWSSGAWNGRFFDSIPDMGVGSEFISNSREEYFASPLLQDETVVMHLSLEVSGQLKSFLWYEGLQDWVIAASQPKSQCDVHATCGPFTVCDDGVIPSCRCMKGFSIRSPKDWELEDRTGGCMRDTPLDCNGDSSTSSADKFYSVPCVRLPHNAQNMVAAATDESECAKVCLSDCSCTAYSYGYGGCHVWHDELVNAKQQRYNDPGSTKVQFLNLRLAAKEVQNGENGRRRMLIWIFTSATLGFFALVLLLMICRNQKNWPGSTLDNVQGGNGIIAFRYIDLQRATKNFSKKLGSGGFGSVYMGSLGDSNTIAVKMLGDVCQGEKQFRAEVSSIGIIQHINLAKLIGFCSEGSRRMLVYEYMPNHSLDAHLFQSNTTLLSWTTRYKIALGIARGLAYLHDSCRDCIIHCDIKPQNILLDASFIPKITDFGMAKLLQRDLSRVVTTMRGTIGYLAPEWISGVPITTKIDVYSYGMVLFEIISGRRNSCEGRTSQGHNAAYFPLHVAHNLLEGDVQNLVDHKLCGDANLEEVEKVCRVACWCIQDADFDRPTMGEVVQVLEGVREFRAPPLPRLLQAVAGDSPSACTEVFFKAGSSV